MFFSIKRKLGGEAAFVLVGNTGGKTFTDDTITQGATGAIYVIQGQHVQVIGSASEQVLVRFGVSGKGLSLEGGESSNMAG